MRVTRNRAMRRIFGPNRDDVTEWRKLYKKELNGSHSSPNVVWVIKLRRMRWAWHVARSGKRHMHVFGGEI
jgi:hypothetical protein